MWPHIHALHRAYTRGFIFGAVRLESTGSTKDGKAGLRREREAIANVNLYVHGSMGKRNKKMIEENDKKKKGNSTTDQVDGRSGGRDGRDKPELGGCVPAGARTEVERI